LFVEEFMFDRRRSWERLLLLVMSVAVAWLPSRAQAPTTTTISEGLFGGHAGTDKKDAAMSFVQAALSMADAVSSKQIVDAGKFQEGLGKVIDGTVQCLNASLWAKPAK
jgi:hypothetical protein